VPLAAVLQLHYHSSAFNPLLALTSLPAVSKGKAIPVKAWTYAGGSRRLRLPYFKAFGT